MELPFIIDEPEKIINNSTMTLEKYKSLKDSVIIDKKYNDYLKDKSVIVVAPAGYTTNEENKNMGEFIDSHDIVVRVNSGWKISEKNQKYLGKKTDIRYHCMMKHENNGGPYDIKGMKEHGVQWLSSCFPKNLDYFYLDILEFEKINSKTNNPINFHYISDLKFYLQLHKTLNTRINAGIAAIVDLLCYDIKSLHVKGFTFFKDGWTKEHKQEGYEDNYNKLGKEGQEINHSKKPQIDFLDILDKYDTRVILDKEVRNVINNWE
jgi:hypothetical protein